PVDDSTVEFRLASIGAGNADAWRTHMVGMARTESAACNGRIPALQLDPLKQRCTASIPPKHYYETLSKWGLEYGPSFRGIEMLQRGSGEVLTCVRLPPQLATEGHSDLHPALLDACLHLYPALIEMQAGI